MWHETIIAIARLRKVVIQQLSDNEMTLDINDFPDYKDNTTMIGL